MAFDSSESFEISRFIKARAASLGFCLCGITDAAPLDSFPVYQDWIQNNRHGEMQYLASERHLLPRRDPKLLVPWVRSIIVVAWPYAISTMNPQANHGIIAGYASHQDYHDFIPQKLITLVQDLEIKTGYHIQAQIYTDSGPVLERELAVRAGLGWIGRNSCLITPQYGSAVLLAELFVDLDLPIDPPFVQDFCGVCRRCMETCPARCIRDDKTIDARLCLSALTIENKDAIPADRLTSVGNHLFGCDDCQSVCPWNKKRIPPGYEAESLSQENMLAELILSDSQFKEKYAGMPILRAKRRGWLRNICAVLGNLGDQEAFGPLVHFLITERDAVCRVSAAHAITRIDSQKAFSLINQALEQETDPLIRKELTELIK